MHTQPIIEVFPVIRINVTEDGYYIIDGNGNAVDYTANPDDVDAIVAENFPFGHILIYEDLRAAQ